MSTVPVTHSLTQREVAERTTQVEGIQTHFFDHCRIVVGFYDVRFYIGETVPSPAGEPSFVEKLCLVTSPEYAKTFLELFSSLLPQYEKLFGEIRRPPAAPETSPSAEVRE